MTNDQASQKKAIALYIVQQAVEVLATWVGIEMQFSHTSLSPESDRAVTKAKEFLSWPQANTSLQPLRVLFDQVQLSQSPLTKYYWKAEAIADSYPTIPYPQPTPPTQAELNDFKLEIHKELCQLNASDWQNLSLLTLILEKFTSHLSFGKEDIALIDFTRATAAVAVALVDNPEATHLSLVAGDLSGIQNFIYTISSDGALKSLRARSFYLELVTEEIVQQLLAKLKLPRTNVIYAGGGNLYLLAAATDQTKEAVKQVREEFNQWFLDEFQGEIFLALDCLPFPVKHVAHKELAVHWSDISTKNLARQKSCKFADPIEQLTQLLQRRDSHEPCRVCHRDDVETLKPLNPNEPDSVLACGTCRQMFQLGGQLFKVEAIVRSRTASVPSARQTLSFQLPTATIYYHLFAAWKQIVPDSDTVLLVNDWTIDHYSFRHFRSTVPLLLGNYAQESIEEPNSTMPAGEMVKVAQGINRVGYLRMDVDNLGQIFARGLGENQTLPRLAGLSRLMSYFFKVYLNSLAKLRQDNFISLPKSVKVLENAKCLSDKSRPNLLFIYAGGDDLFISGAWNEVVEFAFDVYQCFRAYTGRNPDITLSGGISLADAKFPLYQAADESGEAEEKAKGNGRDSLGLFGEVFKWDEWLGINQQNLPLLDEEMKDYLSTEAVPDLLGVFPFVEQLMNQLELNYSRSFVRNLLITAQTQEQTIGKMKDEFPDQQKAVRYYLHLPKIAYTLARLPVHIRNHTNFAPVRTSLKSPYNAPYFRAIATWIELLNRS
jgi:CRISPR-associated protein Csm1